MGAGVRQGGGKRRQDRARAGAWHESRCKTGQRQERAETGVRRGKAERAEQGMAGAGQGQDRGRTGAGQGQDRG
jgi:hypothetical protein